MFTIKYKQIESGCQYPGFIFLKKTHLPDDARGNQPGIVNGIPLVDGGAADIIEFRAFPATFRHPREGGDPLAVRGRGGLSRHKIAASRRNFSA